MTIQSLLDAQPEEKPRAINRLMAAIRVAAGFDLCEAAVFIPTTPSHLEDFELGRAFLLPQQLSTYAKVMREVLADRNKRLERALTKRKPRKVRARSPEATAASLELARAARARKRSAVAGA